MGKREIWILEGVRKRGGGIQFFAPHEMLVVIEEIVSSLTPWA